MSTPHPHALPTPTKALLPHHAASPQASARGESQPPPAAASQGNTAAGAAIPAVPPERIAAKAYDIWLAKGCPERCDLEHWEAARQELTRAQAMAT